jgi:hypothetical protein
MNRLLFAGATVLAVLLFCKASDAVAGPPGSPPAKGMKSAGQSNKAAAHPKSYRKWTGYCWFARYRCYGYFSPMDQGWFYWCPLRSDGHDRVSPRSAAGSDCDSQLDPPYPSCRLPADAPRRFVVHPALSS